MKVKTVKAIQMIKQHILIKDGTAYLTNYPHLKAHIVAQMHIHGGVSVEDVAEHYDISLSDVHAVIVYYYDNQAEIEQSIADKVARAKEVGKENFHEY